MSTISYVLMPAPGCCGGRTRGQLFDSLSDGERALRRAGRRSILIPIASENAPAVGETLYTHQWHDARTLSTALAVRDGYIVNYSSTLRTGADSSDTSGDLRRFGPAE